MRIASAYVGWFLPYVFGIHVLLSTQTCPNLCSLSLSIGSAFSERVTVGERAGVRGRELNRTDLSSLARRVSEGFPDKSRFRSSSLTRRVGEVIVIGREIPCGPLTLVPRQRLNREFVFLGRARLPPSRYREMMRPLARGSAGASPSRTGLCSTPRLRVDGALVSCPPVVSIETGHAKCLGEWTSHSGPDDRSNALNHLPPSRAADDRPPPVPSAERLPLHRYEYDFVAMGMKYHLVVYAPDEQTVARALDQVETRVRQLDRVMSDYNTESELSQLCDHSGPGQPVRLSPELFEVLDHSLELSRETGGAFDVTVGPVIQLWRTARRTKTLPPPESLQQARDRVGWSAVQLNPLARTAELTRSGMQLDLGGIAAGYACDEALRIFRSYGLPRVLIDASGDVLVGDPPPDREGWKVTVAGLSGGTEDPGSRTIILRNAAITTSGDARQFVEIDGQRYSHIVDPQTGLGLTRRSSTTVIAPTGWQADSYATAMNVLGVKAGIPWIETHPGCSALVVEIQDGGELRTQSQCLPQVTQ